MRSVLVAMRTSMRNMRNAVERHTIDATNMTAMTPPTLMGVNALANSSVTTSAVSNADVVHSAMALLI